ncbi:ABC transporter ATP-binding protein [Oricola sp.]|uniref:ABC transporter ATP-binding protein n=1 Tax=Oricola sp. TaxID=1979950 RepID=UPI0025E213BC|nr:ABC transporter ATP-binding protein [Oricola sp.]MCI5076114.1 ABC transporter ATP-binding protein [Oricola sp.]
MRERGYLILDAVTAMYGETVAVDKITLEIDKGELLSLLGPSGCGKTTTLRMIAGFVPPASGHITINGKDITNRPPHKRNIGVVFQSYALFPHLSALENVAYGLRMRHVPAAERLERAKAALETVGLAPFAERLPGNLSGGQQQRVALARALVIEPEVLLLDEPLSNLDANLRSEMRDEIRTLQQRLGITTIFVTHDQQEALSMSDRIAVMSGGVISELGTPTMLCDAPKTAFTARFLGARTVLSGDVEGGVFQSKGVSCSGAPDSATLMVLRASRLRPSDNPSGPLSLSGTISSVNYLGETFEIDLASASGPVRLIIPSDMPTPVVGAVTRVEALPGAVTFI